jgi:hypothetical protein
VTGIGQTVTTFGPVGISQATPSTYPTGPGTASGSGTINGTPAPIISGTASAIFDGSSVPSTEIAGGFGSTAQYNGTLIYYLEILGPAASVSVNVNALASFSTTALPASTNVEGNIQFTLAQLDQNGSPILFPSIIAQRTWFEPGATSADVTGSNATGYSGGFIENGNYSLLTNTIYLVGLQDLVTIGIFNPGGGSATVSGLIDPTFQIAQGVTNASAYNFYFSDGIGNSPVSATPLPAALPLFAGGLGVIGLLARRRKRKATAVLAAA